MLFLKKHFNDRKSNQNEMSTAYLTARKNGFSDAGMLKAVIKLNHINSPARMQI